jgi:hypothetical protein
MVRCTCNADFTLVVTAQRVGAPRNAATFTQERDHTQLRDANSDHINESEQRMKVSCMLQK